VDSEQPELGKVRLQVRLRDPRVNRDVIGQLGNLSLLELFLTVIYDSEFGAYTPINSASVTNEGVGHEFTYR
jgi:hypothetical protein